MCAELCFSGSFFLNQWPQLSFLATIFSRWVKTKTQYLQYIYPPSYSYINFSMLCWKVKLSWFIAWFIWQSVKCAFVLKGLKRNMKKLLRKLPSHLKRKFFFFHFSTPNQWDGNIPFWLNYIRLDLFLEINEFRFKGEFWKFLVKSSQIISEFPKFLDFIYVVV